MNVHPIANKSTKFRLQKFQKYQKLKQLTCTLLTKDCARGDVSLEITQLVPTATVQIAQVQKNRRTKAY
jgi:hypothetical protein